MSASFSLPPRCGVVDAVLFLESAPFVTGEILHVACGQSPCH